MVDLKYVKRHLKAENILSAVAEVRGIVRKRRSNLCTSDSVALYAGCTFIAS